MTDRNSRPTVADNFGLVGTSPAIQNVLRTIEKLEGDTSPVLITGESGVGKELVARALHDVSPLAGKVFLPVDSASLVGSLMESELFGHTTGAFTGAVEQKSGLVRAADGGTLFLDEIGELPQEVQAKLLRLLQEGEIRPIGATRPIAVKVRMLAATNRDLESEVKHARFRKDLYYRLNVINIHLPPLRERPEDIPALVEHFSRRYAIHSVSISEEVMEAFMAYHWPGNVRELENAIRRMMALKSNPVIQVSDLPNALRVFTERLHSPDSHPADILPLAEIERRHILKAVEHTRGDISTAALMLQIGRTTLYRKIKQYRNESPKADLQSLDSALRSSRNA
ncbi:MAG: sigma-54 dependent transcriptional regulator [Bryobacterales bacterium]